MEWKTSPALVDYPDALQAMEQRVEDIITHKAPEMVWLLEHPPLYTAGTSAENSGLQDGKRFPTYHTGRGGEWTYHGPGQRIGYVMLDLKTRDAMDIRAYVKHLEAWIIATLASFRIEAFTRDGRIGVWVQDKSGKESKIAALGIRVRKWVTFHGISLNVAPDLSHYSGIIPCGITEYGVTSLKALGVEVSMDEMDKALKKEFGKIF